MGAIKTKKMMRLSDLKPYENNARTHSDEQIGQIAASIQEFGFLNPILCDPDGNIIAGHGRYMAAKQLGLETVPCLQIEGLTDEQRRAYILADNRLTELGGWNMELVDKELQDLADDGFDIGLTGFDWDSAAALEPIEEPYNTPEDIFAPIEAKPEETKTRLGDIWQLGRHRLMCGDSTSEDDMQRLFKGDKANLVFTDPPYGVAIGTKNKKILMAKGETYNSITEDIIGDDLPIKDLYKILVGAFAELREHCEPDASYYITAPSGGNAGLMMLQVMNDAGLPVRHTLIWVKNSATFSMGRADYDYRHEAIYYTWTKSHNFCGGYDNTVIDDNQRLEDLSKEELKELVHALKGDGSTTAIYCDKPLHNDLHPTMKPLKLIQRFVYNSSQEGDIVADIFGGSGSTLIVCEKMNRVCYMMELDPHYCDVIIERWEQFTGEKAVKIDG